MPRATDDAERGFVAAFARFREGKGFVLTLTAILALWFVLNAILHFDRDFTKLNLLMSVEAAYALPALMASKAKQEKAQAKQQELHFKQLEYMQHMMEGLVHLLEGAANVERD